jgi:hypothetical protein
MFSDGAYTGEIARHVESTFTADAASCGVETCSQLAACNSIPPSSMSATCSGPATECVCEVTLDESSKPVSGVYSITGDELFLDEAFLAPTLRNPYCRAGDVLTVWTPRYELDLSQTPCQSDSECLVTSGQPDNVPSYCVFP